MAKLVEFAGGMHPDGPFFNGDKCSIVDLAFAPWAGRHYLLTHFRQMDFSGPELERFRLWADAVTSMESFLATKADDDRLMQKYVRYAENTAESLLAKAVNDGGVIP